MGILRGIDLDHAEALVETIVSSGLETIEITMNTAGAVDIVKRITARSGKRLMVGAGTVLNLDLLKSAVGAGATFIVMPTVVDEVMDYCEKNVIPVFPGALTPTEISRAWDAGATMVKVFPSGVFGPEYFKEVRAPFNNIELMACGGVRPDNIRSYFTNGAAAAAFGASIFRHEWLANRDYSKIEKSIRELVSAYSRKAKEDPAI